MFEPAGFAWAKLVPEFLVTNLEASLDFWCGLCGFAVLYDRPDERFAYLTLEGAQLMLEQRGTDRQWIPAPLEFPLGRGVNFQIEIPDLAPVLKNLQRAAWPLFAPYEEVWYRTGKTEAGQGQFLVQDPDGYLLRFAEDIGER